MTASFKGKGIPLAWCLTVESSRTFWVARVHLAELKSVPFLPMGWSAPSQASGKTLARVHRLVVGV